MTAQISPSRWARHQAMDSRVEQAAQGLFPGQASPLAAAQQGLVDDIIEPADTRLMLIKAIEMASNKREQKLPKKHSIMPL